MTYPDYSGIYSVKDVHRFRVRFYDTYTFVNRYVDITGGSVIRPLQGNLDDVVDASSSGDVILLSQGSYSIHQKSPSAGSGLHRGKDVLIIGESFNVKDTVLTYDADGDGSERDSPIFSGGASNYRRQIAFLNIERIASVDQMNTNYATAFVRGDDADVFGVATNCIFNLVNSAGTQVSWLYDNNNIVDSVRFYRCTFANYNSWSGNYSGTGTRVQMHDSVFEGTFNDSVAEYGTWWTNVSMSSPDWDYDTSTYYNAGHLYIPDPEGGLTFF